MKTLIDFIDFIDNRSAIVLLEGKRTVAEVDMPRLIALGKLLASHTKGAIFRSGNAPGADELFCEGVISVDQTRLKVITPYKGHRQKANLAYETISLEQVNLVAEPEVVYQSKLNHKTEKLIDQFVSGERNPLAMKAAYIIRDTVKVLGTQEIPPATFAIFYGNLDNPRTGGTGHTMNVCEKNGVPFIDQRIWFEWLK